MGDISKEAERLKNQRDYNRRLAEVIENAIDSVHDIDVTHRDYAEASARAVISALPDLVKPLEWMKAPDWMDSDICTTCGVYKISDHDILWLPNDETGQEHDTPEAAKAAADAHHRAQIMQAFGVEP